MWTLGSRVRCFAVIEADGFKVDEVLHDVLQLWSAL